MLRTSLRTARALSSRPVAAVAGRQWPIAASRSAPLVGIRSFADQKAGDASTTSAKPAVDTQSSQPTSTSTRLESEKPSKPAPAPRKKGFFRRLRNFFLTLALLGVGGFAGGVWYARINDSFHDFFTEYIPFGEQVVLHLEELEFKRRFPNASVTSPRAPEAGEKITIRSQSGASWRVADQTEPANRRSSAASSSSTSAPASNPISKAVSKPAAQVEESPKPAPPSTPIPAAKPVEKTAPAPQEKSKVTAPKLKSIDLMSLPDAKEPIVRDLVHMLNDLIVVINADGAHGKYGSTIEKAKGEITRIGGRLQDLKSGIEKEAAGQVRSTITEFDAAATDLIKRVENTMTHQETIWRQEFEEQMKAVREGYDKRAELVLEREQKLNEEKLHNKLLEQAIALKKEFLSEVEARVEKERESRIGRINELSAAVSDLEKLSLGWNDVIDTNLRTQQLHVAVEAVRARLEERQSPRPFIRELVAIKESATDDALVNAAIASITPSAYQRGIPSSSQLIDRFRRVASEVRKASLLPDEAGVASHASSLVLSRIMFKKQGLAEGDDVESVLTRTQTYLEEGDLDAATREMTGLQGWAKTLSKDWLSEARKVLEVQQALDVIAAEARLQSLRVE